jgi:hypothetical protein
MSFYGNLEDAKKNAHMASKQIDGLEPGETSPVQNGKAITEDGAFHLPMSGTKEFTNSRTRMTPVGHTTTPRRELHPVPLKKGGVL